MEHTVYREFYVDKVNQTFSDTLVVFGLARVVSDLMQRQNSPRREVRIEDKGPYYLLTCEPGVDTELLSQLNGTPLVIAKTIPTDHYADEIERSKAPTVDWESVTRFFGAIKAGVGQEHLPPRPQHLDALTTINPDAIQGYNGLILKWWSVRSKQPETVRILLDLYSQSPNEVESAAEKWHQLDSLGNWKSISPFISGQQIYNPDQGEGQNQLKANKLKPKDKPKINFWLTEWLRAIGFYESATSRLIDARKSTAQDRDRKILTVAPKNLSFSVHGKVMETFSSTFIPDTPVRFDIFAMTRYLKALLTHSLEPSEREILRTLGRVKYRIVSGFYVAYYKKMGRGRSLMNASFLSFPDWIEVKEEADAREYITLLEEVESIVYRLEENNSDAFHLLQHMRNFLSGDDLSAFLAFTTSYTGYMLQQHHKGNKLPYFTIEFVERIVQAMGKQYADIADETKYPGFHNIAHAIRESTVVQQWRSKRHNDKTYEVRYGLNQELARAATSTEKFLEVLGEFIHTYNAETSRAIELGRTWRPMVEPEDIGDVLRMIDDYKSPRMIAQLLIAYGYTFKLYEKSTQEDE